MSLFDFIFHSQSGGKKAHDHISICFLEFQCALEPQISVGKVQNKKCL